MRKQNNAKKTDEYKSQSKGTKTKPNRGRNKWKDSKDKVDSTNDPAWYSANAELLRDAASIPFSWPTGTTLGNKDKVGYDTVPGIMAMYTVPTIGSSMTKSSPANVASNAIYTFVRHANSGHSNYDAPDLMIYLIAMSHVYSFVTWCQRLLGIVNLYNQRNRYMPAALIKANDVNFDDLKNNIANFRYWLNNFITKVASLAVPATMNVFSRMAFLYSNVYIDGPTVKDQLYMFTPLDRMPFMKFALDSDSKGKLEWLPWTTGVNGLTVSDIETYGTNLFNAIWDQEDFGIMSGDILKAYGDNIIKLAPVPVDFQLLPVYDTMVLHQFKNARVGNCFDVSDITQTNDGTISQLVFMNSTLAQDVQKTALGYSLLNKVMTSDFDQPTPEVVIESTRLMYGYDSVTNYVYCGTELCFGVAVYQFDKTMNLVRTFLGWNKLRHENSTTVSDSEWTAAALAYGHLKAFKYAPEYFVFEVDSNGALYFEETLRVWDIDNYAVLSNEDIIKMHESALMSLFAIPAIAKIN